MAESDSMCQSNACYKKMGCELSCFLIKYKHCMPSRSQTMKFFTKLVACAAVVISVNAMAADAGRKEVVLDTGKGGVQLTVSVPDMSNGPYDYGKNPGIGKAVTDAWNHQEVMFNGAISDTGVVVYQASLDKVNRSKTNKLMSAAEIARSEIESHGFKDRAQKITCPEAPIDGASIVCYKMSGDMIFSGKARPEKVASFLVAISFANDTQGYSLMGTVAEHDAAKFNADPASYEKRASKLLGDLYRNHSLKQN